MPTDIHAPFRFEVNGRTLEATPCSRKHRDLFEAGFVVLSCRKCDVHRVDNTGKETPDA